MVDGDSSVQPQELRSAPEVVAPTNRVNIALPFGNIHVEEASKDLAELAAITAELISTSKDSRLVLRARSCVSRRRH